MDSEDFKSEFLKNQSLRHYLSIIILTIYFHNSCYMIFYCLSSIFISEC